MGWRTHPSRPCSHFRRHTQSINVQPKWLSISSAPRGQGAGRKTKPSAIQTNVVSGESSNYSTNYYSLPALNRMWEKNIWKSHAYSLNCWTLKQINKHCAFNYYINKWNKQWLRNKSRLQTITTSSIFEQLVISSHLRLCI